jgi:hypothetical protein
MRPDTKYDRLLQRVEAIENRMCPMRVIFMTDGDPEPRAAPDENLVVFRTIYETREDFERERRNLSKGSITREPTPSVGASSILCRRRDRRQSIAPTECGMSFARIWSEQLCPT